MAHKGAITGVGLAFIIFAGVIGFQMGKNSSATFEPNFSGEVLVKVNGKPIKAGQLDAQLSQLPQELLAGREAQINQNLLDQLILRELVQQAALEQGFAEDMESLNQLKEARMQLMQNYLIKKKVEEDLTDARLKDYYEQTKANRVVPAVHASHILVKDKAEAEKLIKEATPENFAELAKTNSIGPSAPQGGELGWFERGVMVPAFADAAFAAEKNTIIGKPIQTQFGWHVIYVKDKNDNYIPTFDQLRGTLESELTQQIIQNYANELKANANIEYTAKGKNLTAPATPASEEQKPADNG